MKIYRKPYASVSALAILCACCLYLPYVSAGDFSGTEWKVTRGDTLYAIGRAIFPGDARKQARLRRDIMKLNPSIFAGGANNMKVGIVLKLPGYVAPESAPSKVDRQVSARPPEKVTPKPDLPSASIEKSSSAEWEVIRGDTLYMICRAIYPGDARKQARLGRDIKKLNPSVFADGAKNMKVGAVLKLPDYVPQESVAPERIPTRVVEPAPVPVPGKETPRPETQPVAPAPVVEPQPETPTDKEQPVTSPSRAPGDLVISLGFSYGGDELVEVENGPDIHAGTGTQLRLGYEQMYQQDSGYRISVGLQYYTLIEQRDVYFKDIYLQLAYQYRLNPFLYGIGLVYDTGAMLKANNFAEYDAAIGTVVYLEHIGNGSLAGWGLSATSLDVKEKNSGTSFNANRAEIYYNWRF